jgi:hypothetical protein
MMNKLREKILALDEKMTIYSAVVQRFSEADKASVMKLGDSYGPWNPMTVKQENYYLSLFALRFSRRGCQVGVFICQDSKHFPAGSAAWVTAGNSCIR